MPSEIAPTLLMNITDMIDLSIGAPECGIVDFNMLHTVLHCIAHQIKMRDKPVELRGEIASVPVGDMQTMRTVAIDEYDIGTQESPDQTLFVVERIWKLDADETKYSPLKPKQGADNRSSLGDSIKKKKGKTLETLKPLNEDFMEEAKKTLDKGKEASTDLSMMINFFGGKEEHSSHNEVKETEKKQKNGNTLPDTQTVRGNELKVDIPEKIAADATRDKINKDTILDEKTLQEEGQDKLLQQKQSAQNIEKIKTTDDEENFGGSEKPAKALKPKTSENLIPSEKNRILPPQRSSEKLALVTVTRFEELEETVKDLHDRVYGSFPENEEIIKEVRSTQNSKSITDLWTSLNVSSRLKATETAIQKLGSIIQDLIGESGREMDELKTALKNLLYFDEDFADTNQGSALIQSQKQSEGQEQSKEQGQYQHKKNTAEPGVLGEKERSGVVAKSLSKILSNVPSSVTAELQSIQNALYELRKEFDNLVYDFYEGQEEESTEESKEKILKPEDSTDKSTDIKPSAQLVVARPRRLGKCRMTAREPMNVEIPDVSGLFADTDKNMNSMLMKIYELERKISDCCDSTKKDKGQFDYRIGNLQDQMEGFTKELVAVSRSQTTFPDSFVKNLESMMEMAHTVQAMQSQLNQVRETAQRLAMDKQTRDLQIDTLVEQVEMLKHIKIDREDIEEAMQEKADVSFCALKVNACDFDQACEDLAKGLDFALEKLKMQESLWQNSLDDIQREIEAKLDKQELMPVKDFFNSKLRTLQVNLKKMADLRREAEAAGTRKRLLREVNCISCDAKTVMIMDPLEPPTMRPVPCSLSMKPYLSYELDNIRKTQKCIIPQRNMRDWEQIDKQMTKQPQRVRSDTDKHICNRYCGGHHTVTTPAQRVARTGHFFAQWGPDVVPLSAKMAAGDDGRMYKINVTESSMVGPDEVKGDKSRRKESVKHEGDRAAHSSYVECRCMSSTGRTEKESEESVKRHSSSKMRGAK